MQLTIGLYYKYKGLKQFRNTESKIITYVNLTAKLKVENLKISLGSKFETVLQYIKSVRNICEQRFVKYNKTTCSSTYEKFYHSKIKCIKHTQLLIWQVTGTQPTEGIKRGLFSLIGALSNSLFGTMDYNEGQYSTNWIANVENEQDEILVVKIINISS